MNTVQELLDLGESKNVGYMSQVSMAWYYSSLRSLSEESRIKIRNQISRSSKVKQFLKGSFYYFDYLPKEKGNNTFERYDRKPFIFAFDKIGDTIHGINLNYIPIRDRILLMNKIMLYVVGDYSANSDLSSRIVLDYNIMKMKSTFYEQNIIYRKYLISRGSNYKLIPIKYAKIFGCLENLSEFSISESVIYKAFLRQKSAFSIKDTKKRKKTI